MKKLMAMILVGSTAACATGGYPAEWRLDGSRYWPEECRDTEALRRAMEGVPVTKVDLGHPSLRGKLGITYQIGTSYVVLLGAHSQELYDHEACHVLMGKLTGNIQFHH